MHSCESVITLLVKTGKNCYSEHGHDRFYKEIIILMEIQHQLER